METIIAQQETKSVESHKEVYKSLEDRIEFVNDTYSTAISKEARAEFRKSVIDYISANHKFLTIVEMAKKLGIAHNQVTGFAVTRCGLTKNDFGIKESVLLDMVKKHNNYSNADGCEKENARIKLDRYVQQTGLFGKFLGLPYYTATFEKKILQTMPDMTFVGCEIEYNTYMLREKLNRLEDFPMEMHNCKLHDIISVSEPNTFAHVFLDYMGGIHSFGAEIIEGMNRQIVEVGGIYAFTIQNAQRKGLERNESPYKRANDGRTDSSLMIDRFICEIKGDDYELLENIYYKDKGRVGMNLVVLKRIK